MSDQDTPRPGIEKPGTEPLFNFLLVAGQVLTLRVPGCFTMDDIEERMQSEGKLRARIAAPGTPGDGAEVRIYPGSLCALVQNVGVAPSKGRIVQPGFIVPGNVGRPQ